MRLGVFLSVGRQHDVQFKQSAAQHLHMREAAAIGQITKLADFRLVTPRPGPLRLYGCWRPVTVASGVSVAVDHPV